MGSASEHEEEIARIGPGSSRAVNPDKVNHELDGSQDEVIDGLWSDVSIRKRKPAKSRGIRAEPEAEERGLWRTTL